MGGCVSIRKISAKKVLDASLKATTITPATKNQMNKISSESTTYKSYNLSSTGNSSSSRSSGFFSNPSTPTPKSANNVRSKKKSKRRNKYMLSAQPICDDFNDHMWIHNEKTYRISYGYVSSNCSDITRSTEGPNNAVTNNTAKKYLTALNNETDEISIKSFNECSLGKTSTPLLRKRIPNESCYRTAYNIWCNELLSKSDYQLESNCLSSSNVVCICHENFNRDSLNKDDVSKTTAETFRSVRTEPNTFQLIDFKLEPLLLTTIDTTSEISEEWPGGSNGSGGWKGTSFLIEIEETETVSSSTSTDYYKNNEYITETINATDILNEGPKIIVRAEEVFIVGLVLMLWIGAIVLFFNRWGKIRMLEPYQPKFQQQHRASCLTDTLEAMPPHQHSTTRMSMGLITNNVTMPTSCQFAKCKSGIYSKGFMSCTRPRQNSVFVEPSTNRFFMTKPPRKTRSAMDLHSTVFNESAESV